MKRPRWTNYHCHTNFCDGKNSLQELVDRAETLGMPSLGISSHAPLPFHQAWSMAPERLTHYINSINQLKQSCSLELYRGLEVDFIPGFRTISDFSDLLDFTVGSVHFAGLSDQPGFEIDGSPSAFAEGLQGEFNGDIRKLVHRYFELTRSMVELDPPTIIGHLDKIKMQNNQHAYFDENDAWYRNEIDTTLHCIAKGPCLLEVNTRGMYLKKTLHPYPSPWVLERAHSLGIPVTLSSDAHRAEELVEHFQEAAQILSLAGYREIHILANGKWKPVRFNESGIL